MCKTVRTLLIMLFLSLSLSTQVHAADRTEINTLIEKSQAFDGQTVTVEGEALGEAMLRGEYAWINISDNTNAIGVWLKASDAQKISVFGDYRHKGDTVKITGIFSRNCAEHGGDVDIHNQAMEIIEKGTNVPETITQTKINAASALFLFALLSAYIYWRRVH